MFLILWQKWHAITFLGAQRIKAGSEHQGTRLSGRHPAAAKSLQSCPTLCDPIHGSPPGSPIPGILQARTLEWVAISFSNAWKWKVKVKSLSHVGLLVTPWTAAYQAPPSVGFSRQEYRSGRPLPSVLQSQWLPRWLIGKECACQWRFNHWVRKSPRKGK